MNNGYRIKKYDSDYLLMKSMDIMARLIDNDVQNNRYWQLETNIEAKAMIESIQQHLKEKYK